jgi:hypothetical protein
MMARQRNRAARIALGALLALGVPTVLSVPAPALAASSGWMAGSRSVPTNLQPGGSGFVVVEVYNIGAIASTASATITDTLPEALTGVSSEGWQCTATTPVTCTHELKSGIPAEEQVLETLEVKVKPGALGGSFPNEVTVSGGGAPGPTSTSSLLTISSAPASFGFAAVDSWFSNADGALDTQAGSHPYALMFNWELNTSEPPRLGFPAGREEIRNLTVNAPPGVIGDPNAAPQCTRQQFDYQECPAASQIGFDRVGIATGGALPLTFTFPVYNIVPPPGIPAQFGLVLFGIHTFLNAAVRSGGDYGITERVNNIPQRLIVASSLTLWGIPADPSHNAQRCTRFEGLNRCGLSSQAERRPFLTLPTSCTRPQTYSLRANTWRSASIEAGDEFLTHDSFGAPSGFSGCDHLGFGPSIAVAPDTAQADTPAGLTVEVRPPVGGLEVPEGLSTADIQNTMVTLPEGLVINPGQAAGLQACQSSQDGLDRLPDGEEDNGPPSCPNASKVGTDEIETPLLRHSLKGNVYVLQSNPPELRLLVTAEGEGVFLKLVGVVHLDERTGQLTTTFQGTPELPFTDFRLSFSGGAQAALDTPTQCGTYTATSDFTPWSSPFVADVFPSASFDLAAGPNATPCPSNPMPFAPAMIAGSTTDQAGAFTNFSLLLQRGDGQQRIEKLQFKAPAGLGGMLSTVPLCWEPQAGRGECSAVSQIGHASVASGPGPYPLVIPQPGNPESPIYLTGPYGGAPFGLSIVTHVIAGPFNLGTIVTRARIEIDPHTAQITVTTDPLPQVVAGVPTDLRLVNSVIDRPGFMFNPTNCDPSSFSGTAWGTPPPGVGGPGATAPISSHFQVGSCRGLEFAPKFTVSTSGRTSKASGASLTAKVSYPNAPQGTQADIGSVKVELPKQLPSRLTTLQKACTNAQFEANPAGCPSASFIGHAVVHTPELPVPLEGPAIFVSHGGEAFPSLTVVLQGDGVTVDLVGATFINKAGVTSTTFKTVPDAPFSTFELTLPQGPFSALAANGDLCATTRTVTVKKKVTVRVRGRRRRVTRRVREALPGSLVMPNEFVAQNGAVLKQTTKIDVTGCARHKQAGKKAKHNHGRKRKGKRR